MQEYKNITQTVYDTMYQSREARNDDAVLYVLVCESLNPSAVNKSLRDVMLNRKFYGLPSFDSVSRVRRKIQQDNEELRSTRAVAKRRAEKYEKVKAWCYDV